MNKNDDYVRCPKCQSLMILRQSEYGEFFGCNKFPKCKGTRKLEEGYGKKVSETYISKGNNGRCNRCDNYPIGGSLSSLGLCPNCQDDFDRE